MDKRCLTVLSLLARMETPQTAEALGGQLGVSPRTIRYVLKKIDGFLTENGESPLRRGREGVSLPRPLGDISALSTLLSGLPAANYLISQRERVLGFELMLLTWEEEFLTIAQMGQALDVSRSTVVTDLRQVKENLGRAGLRLLSMPRHGFCLQGPENLARDRLIRILEELITPSGFAGWGSGITQPLSPTTQALCSRYFLDRVDVPGLYRFALDLERVHGAVWSDRSFFRVACCAALAQLRRGRQEGMEGRAGVCATRDYRLLAANGSPFLRGLCPAALEQLALYILTAETGNVSYYKKENQVKVQVVASSLIRSFSEQTGWDLTREDSLHGALSEYVSHAYYRIRWDFNRDLLDPAPADRGLVETAGASAGLFRDFVGSPIPEEELRYITRLFAGTRELLGLSGRRTCRAVVVTHQPLGLAAELTARARRVQGEVEPAAVWPVHQFYAPRRGLDADLVLTTVPLEGGAARQAPLEGPGWQEELKRAVRACGLRRPRLGEGQRSLVCRMLDIVQEVCPRGDFEAVYERAAEEFGVIDGFYHYRRDAIMLREILTGETIRFGVEAGSWEEAVRQGGGLMVEGGCVEPRFVDAMVSFVRENGPYVVIAPGIAMPHARPEDGVKRMCMSLITLKRPVEFGNEDNDPVDLVISLAAVDNSSHLDALAELMEILGSEKKLETVRGAREAGEVLALLR